MNDDDGDLKYSNYTQQNQSFFMTPSGKSWHDCANDSASLRLKAFTNDITASAYKAALENKIEDVKFLGKTFTYDGKKHSLAVKGKLPRAVEVSYVGNGKKAVGKYKVTAKFTYGNAESLYVTKKAQLTIKKA